MKRSVLWTAKGGRVRRTCRDEGRGRQAGRGGESRRNDAKTGHGGQVMWLVGWDGWNSESICERFCLFIGGRDCVAATDEEHADVLECRPAQSIVVMMSSLS